MTPPIRESRPYLLAALGSGVASLVCVAALSLRVHADAGLFRMENLVHETRLSHQDTKLEKVTGELAAQRVEMADLWRWHQDAMDAVNTLQKWNMEEDRFLFDVNNAVLDLAEAVNTLKKK